jgi:hypothetical protein
LASETGGRAIVNINDYTAPLQQIIQDASAYYLLGYTSNLAKHDGRFHEISVRVKRPGLTVSARPGYWAWSEEAIAKASATGSVPSDGVKAALESLGLSTADRAFRWWVGTTRSADGRTMVSVAWEGVASRSVARVTVRASQDGAEPSPDIAIAADGAAGVIGGFTTFAATAGSLKLRAVAYDANGAEVDSDGRDLVVPDFSRSIAISTPMVFVARTPREMQAIRSAASARPTASRSFSRADRLLITFGVFDHGAHAPNVTLRVLGTDGHSLADLPAPVVASDGTSQSEIGLSWLAPGNYVLEIHASSDAGEATAFVPMTVS